MGVAGPRARPRNRPRASVPASGRRERAPAAAALAPYAVGAWSPSYSRSGLVTSHHQRVIAYLLAETRVLRSSSAGSACGSPTASRACSPPRASPPAARCCRSIATIVTPDAIPRCHRRLIALEWTYQAKRVGRPGLMQKIRELVLRMATENPRWGYTRIQGEMRELGHRVGRTTVANVLKANGLGPAPDRPTSWRTFLRVHMHQIIGVDFFTTEVWTRHGLATFYVLIGVELGSRRAHVLGVTRHPDEMFMARVATRMIRTLGHICFVICDRDKIFSCRFRIMLEAVGKTIIRSPYQAPNCNAYHSPPRRVLCRCSSARGVHALGDARYGSSTVAVPCAGTTNSPLLETESKVISQR